MRERGTGSRVLAASSIYRRNQGRGRFRNLCIADAVEEGKRQRPLRLKFRDGQRSLASVV